MPGSAADNESESESKSKNKQLVWPSGLGAAERTRLVAMVQGISLALSTTVLGLSIAIPALIGNAWLMRRVESLSAKIEVGVERLNDISRKRKES